MKNQNVFEVARNVKQLHYPDAAVAFAAGSVFRNEGSPFSDIDLVVLYDDPFEDVRRESIEAEGWPVEVFIHNVQAQNYFFDKDRERGVPVMLNLIHEGIEIPGPCNLSHQQKAEAARLLDLGPPALSDEDLKQKRYFISDLLDDLRGVVKPDERYAILGKLYVDLADFHLRANGHWSGMGKGLPRALRRQAPEMAAPYLAAFDVAFRENRHEKIFDLAEEILKPYGGRLFHYKQKAGADWRNFKGPEL